MLSISLLDHMTPERRQPEKERNSLWLNTTSSMFLCIFSGGRPLSFSCWLRPKPTKKPLKDMGLENFPLSLSNQISLVSFLITTNLERFLDFLDFHHRKVFSDEERFHVRRFYGVLALNFF